MRLRALIGAVVVAALAVASTTKPTAALGRPGITPVPCPTQEWQLGNPKFDALPGAKAFFGRYNGGLYEIEIPDNVERRADAVPPTASWSNGGAPQALGAHASAMLAHSSSASDRRTRLRLGRVELSL